MYVLSIWRNFLCKCTKKIITIFRIITEVYKIGEDCTHLNWWIYSKWPLKISKNSSNHGIVLPSKSINIWFDDSFFSFRGWQSDNLIEKLVKTTIVQCLVWMLSRKKCIFLSGCFLDYLTSVLVPFEKSSKILLSVNIRIMGIMRPQFFKLLLMELGFIFLNWKELKWILEKYCHIHSRIFIFYT